MNRDLRRRLPSLIENVKAWTILLLTFILFHLVLSRKWYRADTQKQQCNLCIQQTDENNDAVKYNDNHVLLLLTYRFSTNKLNHIISIIDILFVFSRIHSKRV